MSWLEGFDRLTEVGVEGTGSSGAGVGGFLTRAGVEVVEVDRQNRQARRNAGKSDPLDALEAASRKVQAHPNLEGAPLDRKTGEPGIDRRLGGVPT